MRQHISMIIALFVMLMMSREFVWAQLDDSLTKQRPPTEEPKRELIQMQHWGSTNPEDLPLIFATASVSRRLSNYRIRYYGWVDGGGYYSSTGSGEQELGFPVPNRFSDQLVLDAVWLTVERPLRSHPDGWDWGFRADFYAGQDAALLRPLNNFGPQSSRLGTDFRQAFLSLHLPLITEGGIDLQLGRQNVPIGYETILGPYKPMYSTTYYWIYHQVGSTAVFATLHANKHLDVITGADLNYNTVFEFRGRAPSYLAKVVFTPRAESSTVIVGDVYTGPMPVPTAPGHSGSWQTLTELEVRRKWSPRVLQVVQGSYEWDAKDPAESDRSSVTQGAFSLTTIHLTHQTLDLNLRGEWMHDANGIRTHFPGTFGEATVGLNIMPVPWINLRPEVRGDFASSSILGPLAASIHKKNQLTAGGDIIFKF